MAKYNDIELRSEKVRNIIGNIPPLMIRSGISFIALLICCLLLAAWFIPYPENLKVPVTISSPMLLSVEPFWQATASIPYTHITQIAVGMPVQVELEGYPARIYGHTHGSVTHINKAILKQAEQNYFTVTISIFPSQSTIDNIDIQDGMNAQAFILLSDESILKHILKSFSCPKIL